MRRTAAILALIAVASLLGASDVLAGSAGTPAGKTVGPAVLATVVIDVTGGISSPGKGKSSVRVQRSGSSLAAFFDSSFVGAWSVECAAALPETDLRFVGLMSAWVPPSVLTTFFGSSGNKAAIVDTDYAICTDVPQSDGSTRHILSFTATIQFQP